MRTQSSSSAGGSNRGTRNELIPVNTSNTERSKACALQAQLTKDVNELLDVLLAGGSPGDVCPICSLPDINACDLRQHLATDHADLLKTAAMGVTHLAKWSGRCLICMAAQAKDGPVSAAGRVSGTLLAGRQHILLAHLPECLALAHTITDLCTAAPVHSHAPRTFSCPASTLCHRSGAATSSTLPKLNACRSEPMAWSLLATHLLQQHFMKLLSFSIARAQGCQPSTQPVAPTSKSARRAAATPLSSSASCSKPQSRPHSRTNSRAPSRSSSCSGAKPRPPLAPSLNSTCKPVLFQRNIAIPAGAASKQVARSTAVTGRPPSSGPHSSSRLGFQHDDDLMNKLFEAAVQYATLDGLLPSDSEVEEWLRKADATLGTQYQAPCLIQAQCTAVSDQCDYESTMCDTSVASVQTPLGRRLMTQASLSIPSSPGTPGCAGYASTRLPTDEEVEQWFSSQELDNPFLTQSPGLAAPPDKALMTQAGSVQHTDNDDDSSTWHSTLQISPHELLEATAVSRKGAGSVLTALRPTPDWPDTPEQPFTEESISVWSTDGSQLDLRHLVFNDGPESVGSVDALIGTAPEMCLSQPDSTASSPGHRSKGLLASGLISSTAHLSLQAHAAAHLQPPGGYAGVRDKAPQGLLECELEATLVAAAAVAFNKTPPVSAATYIPAVGAQSWPSSTGHMRSKPELIGAFTSSARLTIQAAEDTNDMATAVLAASEALDERIKSRTKRAPRDEAVSCPPTQ